MTTDPTNHLTERFDDALTYASRIHRAQRRKGADIPYVSHLLGVAAIAIENGATEDQAIAALLHDAVEDQGGAERLDDIGMRFGEEVARIVDDCTDSDMEPKPPWRARKEAYLTSLSHKPAASLEVSIADKTHNAGAIVADRHVHGEQVWTRFTGGKDGSLWYYRALADAFAELAPGTASDRFARLVREMERLA
ncbi:HD domain-containing protein [Qipengyuania flava]|uniref:HD domain-containing protein n=1 Tax=Qipengyuania flava TaxID=192812 RepID=UPI003BB07C39